MTLSIGGTIFCCRSVLLNQFQSTEENSPSVQSSQNGVNSTECLVHLVMFSVIVALLPIEGSLEQKKSAQKDGSQLLEHVGDEKTKEFRSQNFPVIRRIHLSLSRLCAVLEREELRCLYMSRQVSMLLEVGALVSVQNKMVTTDECGDKKQNVKFDEPEKVELMITAKPPKSLKLDISSEDDASKRRMYRRYAIPLHGNLASELVDVYFALARNDVVLRSSSSSLLTGRDGIIYINLHIAVNIEAASKRQSEEHIFAPELMLGRDTAITLRPYHTILFPNVSANELLCNLSPTISCPDGDLSQRSLHKVLLVCDPFKSLLDISLETALPLSTVIGVAASLVDSGACVPVPVINSLSRFACQNGAIATMSSLKLDFSQQFSHICPIHVVVAALTANRKPDNKNRSGEYWQKSSHVTFGEVIRYCRLAYKALFHSEDVVENEVVVDLPCEFKILTEYMVATLSVDQIVSGQNHKDDLVVSFQSVEGLLISMTTWLRSHSVIIEVKEYYVAIGHTNKTTDRNDVNPTTIEKGEIRSSPYAYEDMDAILRECISKNYLDGDLSSQALAWKLGISARRMEAFRDYGVREHKLHVVTRIPYMSDDWYAP
jgi:hypothetical protein